MTSIRRFFIGGAGALMPILVTLVSLDIGNLLLNDQAMSVGNIIGAVIRYTALFVIGGFIAYLHEDELKPYKLFQIGIAAPALITSFVTANSISAESQNNTASLFNNFFIASAHAEESFEVAAGGGFWSDVVDGVSGNVYGKARSEQRIVNEPKVLQHASPEKIERFNSTVSVSTLAKSASIAASAPKVAALNPCDFELQKLKQENERLRQKLQQHQN